MKSQDNMTPSKVYNSSTNEPKGTEMIEMSDKDSKI